MIIAIDFDGTCVTHEFPKVGKEFIVDVRTKLDEVVTLIENRLL